MRGCKLCMVVFYCRDLVPLALATTEPIGLNAISTLFNDLLPLQPCPSPGPILQYVIPPFLNGNASLYFAIVQQRVATICVPLGPQLVICFPGFTRPLVIYYKLSRLRGKTGNRRR